MKYHLVTLMLSMFFYVKSTTIIINTNHTKRHIAISLSLSHLHVQLCLQYLHVPVSLLVKQLLATAVFVSVLRPLSSVELWAGQIQTAVCQGVKLAALQSIAGGQDCAQQLEKDPSPSSYTHTLPKYPPVPSLTLPHSQKEQEWFWDTKKKGLTHGDQQNV